MLERHVAEHGRLPRGVRRLYGISRWSWYRHKRGCKGRLPWWRAKEYERRRANVWFLRRYAWQPGQSGNRQGRPVGAKDRHAPRRRPCGIAAAIRAERGERRELAERIRQQNAIAEESSGAWDYFGSGVNAFK